MNDTSDVMRVVLRFRVSGEEWEVTRVDRRAGAGGLRPPQAQLVRYGPGRRDAREGRAGQAGQRAGAGSDRARQRRLPAHRDPAAGTLRPSPGRGRAVGPHRDPAPGVADPRSRGGGGGGAAAPGRGQDLGGAAEGRGGAPSGRSRRAPCTAHFRGRRDEPSGHGAGRSAGPVRAGPGDRPSLGGDHRGGPAGGRTRDPAGDGRTGRAGWPPWSVRSAGCVPGRRSWRSGRPA